MFHYRGADVRAVLDDLRDEPGNLYDGVTLRFVNPASGAPVFPTLDYRAMLLPPGAETRFKRETAGTLYQVIEGRGTTEIAGQSFDWEMNDIFVVPGFAWRRHLNRGDGEATPCSTRCRTCRFSTKSGNTAPKAASRTAPSSNLPSRPNFALFWSASH